MFTDRDRFSTFTIRRSWGSGRGVMIAAGLGLLLVLLAGLVALDPQPAVAQDPTPSTDATLSQWEWRTSGGPFDIDHCFWQNRGGHLNPGPAFTSGNTVYQQTVSYRFSHVAVKAKATDGGASITFSRAATADRAATAIAVLDAKHGFGKSQRPVDGCPRTQGDQNVSGIKYTNAIPLDYGGNTINVKVTAADGTTKTYSVAIVRGIGVSFSVDGRSVYHQSLHGMPGQRGIVVDEGQSFTIRVSLTGPAPSRVDVSPRVWLRVGNTDQVKRGNAEFSDLGAGDTKHRVQTPGGWHYAAYPTLSFATGESGSKTVKVTLPADTDKETDTFWIEPYMVETGLVGEATYWPRAAIIIRDVDAPNAPRNLTVAPGDRSLRVSWAPPTGSSLPTLYEAGYYSRESNGGISLNGYEVQYKEQSAPDQRGTPGNPSTGWTTAGQHFTYKDGEIAQHHLTIRHVKPGTAYVVRVRGLNRDAAGAWATAQAVNPTGAADSATRMKVGWTATLTAGQTRHSFGIGCLFYADLDDQTPCGNQTLPLPVKDGGLEPHKFNFWYDGRTYTVNGLYRIDSHHDWAADPFREQLQRLDLNLDRSLPAGRDLRLRIGGEGGMEFKLASGANGGGNYRWNVPGFFWQMGDRTEVSLVEVMQTQNSCRNCGFGVRELPEPEQPKEETQEPEQPQPQEDPEPTPEPEPARDPEPEPQAAPQPEPEPEPELSEFAKTYDADGNNVIDINEYIKAGRDYGSSLITFEQLTEVKDAWIEGTKKSAGQTSKVKTTNRPPTIQSAFEDVTLVHQGDSQQISTAGRFSDPDGHTIVRVEAASSAPNVATVSVATDDSSLTVTARSSGTATITVRAHDGHNGNASTTFTVTVKSPPRVDAPLPDISNLAKDGREIHLLAGVFSDPDGDKLTFSLSMSKSGIVYAGFNTDSGRGTTTAVVVNGRAPGTTTVTLTVRDTDGNEISDSFDVTVPAPPTVNNAPKVAAAIADATIVNTSGAKDVALSGVFSDADTDDTLTITAASSKTRVATVSVASDGSKLTVTAKSRGSATITVTASDGEDEVSDSFTVKVKAAPTVASAIADISNLPAVASREISLSSVFSDADGDTLAYGVLSSNEDIAAAYDLFGNLLILGVKSGQATITLTAEDSDGNQVSDSFTVTVTEEVNKAPTVASAIADITITNTSGTKQVSLFRTFNDEDQDDLTITAASSVGSVATVSVASDGSKLTVTAKSRGTATITVTASDGEDEVSDTFMVKVKAAPVVASASADIGALEAEARREISLTSVFSDADGDALQVSVTTSDREIVNISVALDGTTLSATAVTVIGVAEGRATITVTAQDPDGNRVSDTFDVTVPAAEVEQQQVDAVPGQVVSLSVRQVHSTRIRVEWEAPEDGGAVNSYRVMLSRDGEELSTRRPGAKKRHVVIRKLEPGATYTVSVRAKNATGLSAEATAQITLTTEETQ
ncbi:MAG: fibronectin type III domain-containing protein [Chloroflexi bacterium]|nr:fibronectin type III domain-containing protein [Chloroflexota bacterium]